MINDAIKREKKLDKLLKITNISDKELSKLDYKGKQQYFKAKSKLCTVVFTSRDKDGNGITYRKPKEVKNNGRRTLLQRTFHENPRNAEQAYYHGTV